MSQVNSLNTIRTLEKHQKEYEKLLEEKMSLKARVNLEQTLEVIKSTLDFHKEEQKRFQNR